MATTVMASGRATGPRSSNSAWYQSQPARSSAPDTLSALQKSASSSPRARGNQDLGAKRVTGALYPDP